MSGKESTQLVDHHPPSRRPPFKALTEGGLGPCSTLKPKEDEKDIAILKAN